MTDWAAGLSGQALLIARELLAYEDELSDGFGYYGSMQGFQSLCIRLAQTGDASARPSASRMMDASDSGR